MPIKELVGFGPDSFVVSPSDTAAFGPARGFQPGADGNVTLGYPDGSTLLVTAVKAGIQYAYTGFTQVRATGTTATDIVVGF